MNEAALDRMRLRAMKKIVKAAHRKRIDTFVSVGASAKPISLLFKPVWKALYPNEMPPKMVSLGRFIARHKVLDLFSKPDAVQKLFEHRPVLRESVKGRLMLFDEMAIWGSTPRLAKTLFKKAGARNVTTAVLFSTEKRGQPFFPGEGLQVRLRKVADVIGEVNRSIDLVQEAAYYKERAWVYRRSRKPGGVKAARARLKIARAHLKLLGKSAAKRKRH